MADRIRRHNRNNRRQNPINRNRAREPRLNAIDEARAEALRLDTGLARARRLIANLRGRIEYIQSKLFLFLFSKYIRIDR